MNNGAPHLAAVPDESRPGEPTAEQRMWAYYVTERSKKRMPTGAELDRIAGTNNYGRRLLRRWRQQGRTLDSATAERRLPELAGAAGLMR